MSQLAILLAVVSLAISAVAQTSDDIARIVGTIMTNNGAPSFLETLTDTIGGRLTGSPENRAAADLILKTLREAGFDNAHFEEYKFASAWQRGPISGEIVGPIHRRLFIGSYGWTPGTAGRIEAPLLDLGAPTKAELPGPQEKYRGAAILVQIATTPDPAAATSYIVMRAALTQKLARAGAAAMLVVSDKPDRMVYTSAFGFYPHAPLPALSIANEDAQLLRRLLAKQPVRLALEVQNSFGPAPATERNVVADLPGTESGEVVLLGAHFDSWDPAQGANDNGSGVAQVMEAARTLKRLGIKPKHTIRFVFFSGEEEDCLGSRAYVGQHRAELGSLRAVLITDDGAQAPLGFQIHAREDMQASVTTLLQPLAPLEANRIYLDIDFESDYEPFILAGIPSLSLHVEPADYDVRHHTIADTYEKVDPRTLSLDAAVMAVAAYSIANAEQGPGRRLSPDEVKALVKKAGLEPQVELDEKAAQY